MPNNKKPDVLWQQERDRLHDNPEAAREAMRRGFDDWLRNHTAEHKAIIKLAIQEWLDAQFAQFGKFSLYGAISIVMATVFYLYLSSKGFSIDK